ncbi:cytochrome c oxidase assembly protein subunit 11 [Dongia mobilis]|uniref:Cytochrome c oxidase assembly protein CtaG n=1 Tax=Dongia mobilis TaxID=578943 RepID=A0A4R6WU30_9PROT|nr:cytochrome c oxidase assembly protein [Dongia mobilis]TDQ82410.1 cytochrome c oxidase assembly protein subunit 11 [Dongia mobilis]
MAATPESSRNLGQRNRNVMMWLVGLVAGMTGLAFASVPLYDLFCRVTGFGGTPMRAEEASVAIGTRDLTVTFNADLAAGMPWRFFPTENKMTVRTGVTYTATYVAENPTGETVTGSSTFNVSPDIFGKYFVKVQCFCFERQELKPGERVEMPVVFYLDPQLEEDPYLGKIGEVTLSYTFFRVENDPVSLGAVAPDLVPEATVPAQAGQNGGS